MIQDNIIRTKLYALTNEFFLQDWVVEHRRWACYFHYGVTCCVPGCARTGTHVLHWYSAPDFKKYGDSGKGEHIDLIGYEADGTTEYLMTVDHIIPHRDGGPKIWWNLQPMCQEHNNKQGARTIHRPSRARLELIQLMSGMGTPEKYSVVGALPPTDDQLFGLLLDFHNRNKPNPKSATKK